MKKVASILVFVFAFTLITQAQKKRKNQKPKLSMEQHTILAVKKMTLELDLSKKQQDQMMPLIKAKVIARKEAIEKKKALKKSNSNLSADDIFRMKSNILDNQIAMKKNMKEILNKEQFEKFEKISKLRMIRGKKTKNNNRRMSEGKKE